MSQTGQVDPLGPLLASGRDADIFEYGDGLVLRRSRAGKSMVAEAQIMEYVAEHGYPVPIIEDVRSDGTELVMQRIHGFSMVDAIPRKPWTIRGQGRVLAELHHRLHQIAPPSFLPPAPVGAGDRILHLDLHPLNVMISPSGPVVIDWANASLGEPAIDVALAWVLIASGDIPGGRILAAIAGRFRSLLLQGFVGEFDRPEVSAVLRDVVTWKVNDPHMSSKEQARMWAVVEEAERP